MLLNCLALASQSGHSEGMHGQYTADSHLPAGIDFHTFFEIMQVSGVWHELIGFLPISQPTLLEAMMHIPSYIGKASHIFMPRTEGNLMPSTADIAEEVKHQILPDILQAISQSHANDLAYLLDHIGIVSQSPPSWALMQPVTHIMHPSWLHDLCTFLNDDSASFNDPQQALALKMIHGREPSILLIGPTGE